MSAQEQALRAAAREVLAELLPDLLAATVADQTAARPAPIPQIPAPPVAAVHRPSTWSSPAPPAAPPAAADTARTGPGSVRPPAAGSAEVVRVRIESDADLDGFVRELARRLESPRDRRAIRSGALQYRLERDGAAPTSAEAPTGGDVRVERGAVTERAVRAAAGSGSRLVLGPRAVLTPLAKDVARSLGVEIEREPRC